MLEPSEVSAAHPTFVYGGTERFVVAPERWRLLISGPDRVERMELQDQQRVSIGRLPENDLFLPDGSVSRRHAILTFGKTPQVQDLGSSNGTQLNGRTVEPHGRRQLKSGDVLRFGGYLIVLEGPGANQVNATAGGQSMVVKDPAMQRLYETLNRVAQSHISVLILGETGVGKELVAEALHRRSGRVEGPMVRLNCGAISESLITSELFGHEKGAFTGAVERKVGLLEAASGGTLFLDEIGDMPHSVQIQLLRVLEERKVKRVGGVEAHPIDVRIVAATHKNLEAEVRAGRFREDLYFRLSGIVIEVPPLRKRQSEICELAQTFCDLFARRDGIEPPVLSGEARVALQSHRWPGNVRELRNVMERAVALCQEGVIQLKDLPSWASEDATFDDETAKAFSSPEPAVPPFAANGQSLADYMASIEKQWILDALERCAGNQSEVARQLGIPRRTLVSKLDQYGVPRPRKKR